MRTVVALLRKLRQLFLEGIKYRHRSTQIRAARAILGWSVRDLAMRAFVSIAAVNLIEAADALPSKSSGQLAAARATLEAAGIQFLEGDAIARRTPPSPPAESG